MKTARVAEATRPGYFYFGVAAGQVYAEGELFDGEFQTFDKDRTWMAGPYIGYMLRQAGSPIELGVEADYMWTSIKFNQVLPEESDVKAAIIQKDKWNASVRARAGIHLGEPLMLYGTGGLAWDDLAGRGWAYGGGLELALVENVSIRGEYLRYEFDEGHADVIRAGLTVKIK